MSNSPIPPLARRSRAPKDANCLLMGCTDRRVPLKTLTGRRAGEMFAHRNIANQLLTGNLNVLSVCRYAVEVLDVEARHRLRAPSVRRHDVCHGVSSPTKSTIG